MKPKTIKILIGLVVVVVLYQGAKWAYGEAAEAYFNYRCENDAGEFIYRTVENVEGLYQMRLRDPRYMIDRLRKGDIPEDPYGHTDWESQRPWEMFIGESENKYQYYETTKGPDLKQHDLYEHLRFAERPIYTGEKYWKYSLRDLPNANTVIGIKIKTYAEQSSVIGSKYGFTWQEVRGFWDKLFGIWGGELIVKELDTDEVLGLRKGYFFINKFKHKAGQCPKGKDHDSTYKFVSKVLKPVKQGKGEENAN